MNLAFWPSGCTRARVEPGPGSKTQRCPGPTDSFTHVAPKTLHSRAAAVAAKSLQSCPTLCDPIDSSPPGSLIPGILQARTLEWVAISFSNVSKWKVKVKSLSRVWLLATPWTAAYQAPPSMGFSRQEYWSGVPLPSLHSRAGGKKNTFSLFELLHPRTLAEVCPTQRG